MDAITFINGNGQTVELTKSPTPYLLKYLEGAGGPETDVQLQKSAFQDGQNYLATYLEPRILRFQVSIHATSEDELFQYRRELSSIFNPKLGLGELIFKYGTSGEKRIECAIDRAPQFLTGVGNRTATYQLATFNLIAPNPFWTDNFVTGEVLSVSVPQFKFDLRLTDAFAFEVQGTNRTIIDNQGDVETPVTLLFKGPAINPKIENETTGEFIAITKTLLDGESIEISTEFGNKYVLFNDGTTTSNAFGDIDLDSTFWSLQVGENSIAYTADAGIETAELTISYRQRFVGV